jgi:hypothetical protein
MIGRIGKGRILQITEKRRYEIQGLDYRIGKVLNKRKTITKGNIRNTTKIRVTINRIKGIHSSKHEVLSILSEISYTTSCFSINVYE